MRQVVPGPCPTCGHEIEYCYQTENIPFFSDILIISASCPECGFRYADTQMLKHEPPARYVFSVEGPEDLSVRVMRSMQASIEIPEMGVRIDPGPKCDGFVSNVEGVLDRFDRVLDSVLIWANDDEERRKAIELKETIVRAKNGEFPFTLIIEDPSGNSTIVSDRATKSEYEVPAEDS